MDSRRVSRGLLLATNINIQRWALTGCSEGRALCASETLYSMDAVAKAPWMGLRRVSEAHKALSLHLTNSCYKVRPEDAV